MNVFRYLGLLFAILLANTIYLEQVSANHKKRLIAAAALLSQLRWKQNILFPFPVPVPVPYIVKKVHPPVILPPKRVPVLVPKPVPVYLPVPKFVPIHHHRKIVVVKPRHQERPEQGLWDDLGGLENQLAQLENGFGEYKSATNRHQHKRHFFKQHHGRGGKGRRHGHGHGFPKGDDLQMSSSEDVKMTHEEIEAMLYDLKQLNEDIKLLPRGQRQHRVMLGDVSLRPGERKVNIGEVRLRPSELKALMAAEAQGYPEFDDDFPRRL